MNITMTRRHGRKHVELLNNLYRPEKRTGIFVDLAGGWSFTVDGREYHTDRDGEGLWAGDKQILGTCQFRLSQNRSTAYGQIRRYFAERVEECR